MAATMIAVILMMSTGTLANAGEALSESCAVGAQQSDCASQTPHRRGQAMLQHRQEQQGGKVLTDEDQHPMTAAALVTVAGTNVRMPTHLAKWADPAGLSQLKTSQEPEGGDIMDYITNTLLPQALMTKQQLDQELQAAVDSVKACGEDLGSAKEAMNQEEVLLAASEQRHGQCVDGEEVTHEAMINRCKDLTSYCEGLSVPKPLQDFKDESAATIAEHFRIYHKFYEGAFPDYGNRKQACIDAGGRDKIEIAQCAEDKKNLEKSYCSLKKKQIGLCQEYEGCVHTKLEQFDKVVSDVKLLEGHVKQNYQNLACFKLQGDESACTPPDTSSLNVGYPVKPVETKCSHEVHTTWDYSGTVCPELGEELKAEESTTPATVAEASAPIAPASTPASAPIAAATVAPTTAPPPHDSATHVKEANTTR